MDGFSIVSQIGAGSYGVVHLVETTHDPHDRFVLKQIDLRKMNHKEKAQAFAEVAILSEVGGHPNIVTFHRSFQDNHRLTMVMDYCDGGDLHAAIQKQYNYNRKRGLKQTSSDYRFFPEAQIWDWFMQICLAVRYLHDRHVLHRDLKSQNIFLTSNGLVKVGDFGISKVLNGAVDMTRTCIGTPFYLSPEICESKPYDTKTDIWSLGCILYEVSALRHPFHATSMKNLLQKITRVSYQPLTAVFSTTLRNLVGQLLKLKAEERPDIHQILSRPFIRRRLSDWLPKHQRAEEFTEIYANKPDRQVTMQEKLLIKGHPRKHRRFSLSPQKCRFGQIDPVDSVAENTPLVHLRADGKADLKIQAHNLYELQELATATLSETVEDENGNKTQGKRETFAFGQSKQMETSSNMVACCEDWSTAGETAGVENDKSCRKCGRTMSALKKTCRKCTLFKPIDAPPRFSKSANDALTRQSAAHLRLALTTLLGPQVYEGLYHELISDGNWLRADLAPPALFEQSPELGQMFRELLIAECVDDLSAL